MRARVRVDLLELDTDVTIVKGFWCVDYYRLDENSLWMGGFEMIRVLCHRNDTPLWLFTCVTFIITLLCRKKRTKGDMVRPKVHVATYVYSEYK